MQCLYVQCFYVQCLYVRWKKIALRTDRAENKSLILFCTLSFFFALFFAIFYPPQIFHYGIGDYSNHENAAARYAYNKSSAIHFYPAELHPRHHSVLDQIFTDMRGDEKNDPFMIGLISPYIFLSRDHQIMYPHFHLLAFLKAALRSLDLESAVNYLNYFVLFFAAICLFQLLRKLEIDSFGSLLAASSMFFIPSMIIGARVPLPETLALLLNLRMMQHLLEDTTRARYTALFYLMLLSFCRPEFILLGIFFALFLGLNMEGKAIRMVTILFVFNVFLTVFYLLINGGHAAYVRVIIYSGLFVPVVYALAVWFSRFSIIGIARNYLDKLLQSSVAFKSTLCIVLACCLAIDLFRTNYCGLSNCYEMFQTRYSIFSALSYFAGWPLLVFSLIGLFSGLQKILKSVPPILLWLLVPQAVVLLVINATPVNIWSWTRRFHVFMLPVLLIGLSLCFELLSKKYGRRPVIGICMFLLVAAGHYGKWENISADQLGSKYVESFHSDVSKLPEESIVLLASSRAGKSALPPMRSFHGYWSYLVWDEAQLETAISALLSTQKPIYLDSSLAMLLRDFKLEDSLIDVSIPYSKDDKLKLKLVEVSRR